LWNAATGEPITAPFARGGTARGAVFSPDGRRVVTASGTAGGTPPGEARVWDAATGEPVGPPLKHTAAVLRVDFSPDGRRVATASPDGTAVVWDAVTGQPAFPPLSHGGAVLLCVAFSPAGDRVVTGGPDGTARLWSARTGQSLLPPLRHQGAVTDAGFSRDGRRLVTASMDGTARVWDVATGRPVSAAMKHASALRQAAFSPDGRAVATASGDSTARVWDAATGEPLTPPLEHHTGFVVSVAFSPDGLRLLTTGEDGTARVWDLRPDARPLPDLIELAQLLSAEQTDATGSRLPVERDTLRQSWQRMRTKYPATFAPSIEQVLLWHQREASAWEQNGDWAAAMPHLDLLVAAEPAKSQHRSRRATAHAALSRWDPARQDFARAIGLGSSAIGDAYGLALAQLETGDTAGYRATCARVLDRFGRSADPNDALTAARICTLLPDAVPDSNRPLQLAEQAADSDPTDNVARTVLGAAFCRAGRYDAAVQRLSQAGARPPTPNAYHGFFLAMTHARLGHASEARRYLEQAAQWLEEALQRQSGDVTEPPLSWQQRLELQLQRREAEALILPAGR
jgi:tetratricopeptide (TPR) repeat protein